MIDHPEPVYDIAQLGHTELHTPDLAASVAFFTEIYGLTLVGETPGAAHLRAWNDDVLSSLTLTAHDEPGLGHLAWRATSPQALHRRVAALEEHGVRGWWHDGDFGHGAAYRFVGVGGHLQEIYFDTEKYVPTPDTTPALPNQPQKFAPRGAAAAHIDHINLLVPDVAAASRFQQETLGFKLRERLVPAGRDEVGAWLSVMTKAHDLALTKEPAPTQGRLHHLAYSVPETSDVIRAADIFLENDVFIEFGPAKHSRTQGFFLYVYEPGGNRIEVFTGGIHIFSPDFETVTWDTESQGRGTAWGMPVPESFHSHATPPYVPAGAEVTA
ncbi:VOC family protein [Lentzea nigeriaca]|uniref:VOC family protein n=1 Tax=Lentzea nigeriaca TaxID=1128665 RepID=UPI00195A5231|nr:VOC family protein [Lentzea nigeriaca]MBM7856398.1 catechol 2,3-dioxygenase [Lentzea nigeriaca]